MDITRRSFALQTATAVAAPVRFLAPAGVASLTTATAIVLPRPANALAVLPLLALGGIIATALREIFASHGLKEEDVRSIAQSNSRPAKKLSDFDGMFADDQELNVSQAWRFQNGKVVGVNGAAYGGDPYAPRRASLNINELDALRCPDTLDGWGAMVPTSMRVPPDAARQKLVVAYKETQAAKQRTRTSRIADPFYLRAFQRMDDGSEVAGAFGRADDGALRVSWINPRDIG